MAREHAPSIKNPDVYEALREQGVSKEKAARIANAQANDQQNPSRKGGEASPYERWTKAELYKRAAELKIEGRSSMNKDELIDALRSL